MWVSELRRIGGALLAAPLLALAATPVRAVDLAEVELLGASTSRTGASANFGGLALQLIWHDFQAEAASDDYGSEWDASAGYKFGTRYEVLAKYANYMADGFATDTTKFWIQLSAAF